MSKNIRFFRHWLVFVLLFCAGSFLFAGERFALVIGNGNYKDRNIANLVNPINDATDVAGVLNELGYDVTLKTNVGLRDMVNSVMDFTGKLKLDPESEGFFWFAGHGLSVKEVHYLLPVDVDPTDEFSIARGGFSVNDLMDEIDSARNLTNLVVIDACRNAVLPGSRSVGGRGLTVLSRDDYRIKGNKIVYSTGAGRVASDGVQGSRNSPFAQAFISKITSPEIFDDVFLDIANETLRLTNGAQEPYAMGAFAVKSYSINPDSKVVSGTMVEGVWVYNPGKFDPGKFGLDGKKVFSLSVMPTFYPSTFKGQGGGVSIGITFFEMYRDYGKFFYLPNSFFVSADLLFNARTLNPGNEGIYIPKVTETSMGGVFGLGALYKIRTGEAQRYILNFGLSFQLMTARLELKKDEFFYYTDGYRYKDFAVLPGLGVHGGFGFRFNQLISLDLGVAWKAFFAYDTGRYKYHHEVGVGNWVYTGLKSIPFHYTIGGSLGVTFWWPR